MDIKTSSSHPQNLDLDQIEELSMPLSSLFMRSLARLLDVIFEMQKKKKTGAIG
jgi:hypothetical protein